VSITPNGANGARCLDVEPGDATPAACPGFYRNSLHNGGQNDAGKPMIYTSAGDLQAVINAMSGAGIARSEYLLWSAHWIGQHICAPNSCGYPASDATQYASNSSYDSDVFYSYCFGPGTVPSPWPLEVGSTDTADVKVLQADLNKWASEIKLTVPLVVDGAFGALTEAAVVLAQKYFGDKGAAGTASQTFVSNNLAKTPGVVVTPPPPPPWVFGKVVNLKVPAAGPSSFKVEFDSPAGKSPQPIARYEVGVCKGTKLGAVVPSYPRYIQSIASGSYGEQYGSLAADTEYVVAVRAQLADGSHSSEWSTVVFKTAVK
jgi:hypothetical protein